MKVSVISGHPYGGSFNAAIARIVTETLESNGHTVMFHDLYNENFSHSIPPKELVCDVSDDEQVALHQREIREADREEHHFFEGLSLYKDAAPENRLFYFLDLGS